MHGFKKLNNNIRNYSIHNKNNIKKIIDNIPLQYNFNLGNIENIIPKSINNYEIKSSNGKRNNLIFKKNKFKIISIHEPDLDISNIFFGKTDIYRTYEKVEGEIEENKKIYFNNYTKIDTFKKIETGF